MFVSFRYFTKNQFHLPESFFLYTKNIRDYFGNPTHNNSGENSYDPGLNFPNSNRISYMTVG